MAGSNQVICKVMNTLPVFANAVSPVQTDIFEFMKSFTFSNIFVGRFFL